MEKTENKSELEFTPVSIDSFFDKPEIQSTAIFTGITVFTTQQEILVNQLLGSLQQESPDRVPILEARLLDLEKLATDIAAFPSLLGKSNTTTDVRTSEALIDSLLSYQEDGDTTLHLPSKATLGKSFLITKIHIFKSMHKLARDFTSMEEKEVKKYLDETVSMMFTLMAEDVYMNLIKDKSLSLSLRRDLALSLIILWEHRADQNIEDIAPVLQAVWRARRQIAPIFGTMMGTSELIQVSMQMDEQWTKFIRHRMDDPDVAQAMEEFLFGVSYEQVQRLKTILKEQGVKNIGRDEVSLYLNERVKTDISLDYRDFYLLYTVRRDNARARARMHIDGPKHTLEDHFIRFTMEQNAIIQENDITGL